VLLITFVFETATATAIDTGTGTGTAIGIGTNTTTSIIVQMITITTAFVSITCCYNSRSIFNSTQYHYYVEIAKQLYGKVLSWQYRCAEQY
jgi:hypothetical protein